MNEEVGETERRRVTAVLFDWDGTVVSSAEAIWHAYRYAYRTHLNIEFPSNQAELRTIAPMRLTESSAQYGGEYADAIAHSYSEYYQREAYKTGRVFEGMKDVLVALQDRGYRIGVATNKGIARIRADMEYLGLQGYFESVVTSEDTPERKPHPAPLLALAMKMNIVPERCAYVGDYRGDILAAHAARMVAVAALWGELYEQEVLLAEDPDYVVSEPADLLTLFPPLDPSSLARNS